MVPRAAFRRSRSIATKRLEMQAVEHSGAAGDAQKDWKEPCGWRADELNRADDFVYSKVTLVDAMNPINRDLIEDS